MLKELSLEKEYYSVILKRDKCFFLSFFQLRHIKQVSCVSIVPLIQWKETNEIYTTHTQWHKV